ncbi:synaptophysin-like protein 1 [Oenanthe melanoleuca]|uniref:synaptophysin-like protein 1 n=1 Tax=Oenanthe melanoleuca TaxID=2939378 RepID=UPI0024C1EA26|nr:synaptophysin-like protein 1 [Oenanthe melanoleuca]
MEAAGRGGGAAAEKAERRQSGRSAEGRLRPPPGASRDRCPAPSTKWRFKVPGGACAHPPREPPVGPLNTAVFSAPDPKGCGGTWTDAHLMGNFSSSAQLFVTLAALVFLYCITALVVYIGYNHVYRHNNKVPLTDLAISVLTAFLWLVSTFVWAKALADIKESTGASIIPGIESCKAPGTTCHFLSVTSMGSLNVSVVFGLLNMILWAGNVWLLYKDTNLHNQWNRISESTTEGV